MHDIAIVGGGLGGLVSAICLAKNDFDVVLVEKKQYPFHKVCGEYISNEVKLFLESIGLKIKELDVSSIDNFQFTSPSGKSLETQLDLGGFGVSRYTLDFALYKLAIQNGVKVMQNTTVESIDFEEDTFRIKLVGGETLFSKNAIGSYGKRTKLDALLNRSFLKKRSPYLGVKYHIKTDFPKNKIALHNFQDGYCGISAIENDKYCLCYLSATNNLKQSGSIEKMEKEVIMQNPFLKNIFLNSEFLYEKPEVINEISFAKKNPVENHLLMVGDTAGLITPLCGNGMAMAISAAKMAAELLILQKKEGFDRGTLENKYVKNWFSAFSTRLWVGRNVQNLFGDKWLSELAVVSFTVVKPALRQVIKLTHGDVLPVFKE
jgi:menaquinone-9 beta-reductase